MNRFLRCLRRTLAVVVGGAILLFFLDVTHTMPRWMSALLQIQVVPALLAGSAAILAVLFLVMLLFGRVYCSVVCPLGILQDVILRFKKWWLRIVRKRKRLRTRYARPLNVLRYGVLVLVGVPLLIGLTYPLLLLDPYSGFGRIAVGLFRPVAVWINNLLAGILNAAGNYSLYLVPELSVGGVIVAFAVILLVALIVLVWTRERLWCNAICPVGTLLGLISRFSLFRVTMDRSKCNSCGTCASNCKSRCIDSKSKTVDTSRCVTCFDCLERCPQGGITYAPTGWSRARKADLQQMKKTVEETVPVPQEQKEIVACSDLEAENELSLTGLARRRFLKGSLLTLAALPMSAALGKNGHGRGRIQQHRVPLPPGAVSFDHFMEKCTACQLCVSKCPTQVLQPAFLENGLTGMMRPYMRFKVESFCNFECNVCSEVCPNDAIIKQTLEEKKLTRVGVAHFRRGHCVVFRDHQDCGACAEHCPTQAVHMVPFQDGLTIPQVEPELCIGCGGCESICPVVSPAIYVEGLEVQEKATPPEDQKLDVGTIDDFGF